MSGDALVSQAIEKRARQARDWMFDAAFPFWAEHGPDPRGGFAERVGRDGGRIVDPVTRVRLQARQTYCFALAAQLGWQPGRARNLARHGVDMLTSQCRRADGLYGRLMSYEGGLADDTADLYDTAFALLAFSSAIRAGIREAGEPAGDVDAAIETHLRRPADEGGYTERLPAPAERLQNPHMHLFEASLALHAATGDADAMGRARRIETLMEQHFVHPTTGALREVFGADWRPVPGDHFEAGHQYEWVWLLAERARLDGGPVSGAVDGLYASALDLTGEDGAVPLSHTVGGVVEDASERTWGLTEALKAHLARFEAGDGQAGARACEAHDRLWSRHITPAIPGGWQDRYGPDGVPVDEPMTAATGYHVFCAFAELMRVAGIE